jgi:sugar phosphate isomerase/epimerase
MFFSGFADEASKAIDGQIAATQELGWKFIELRNVGDKNAHDVSDAEFEEAAEKLDRAGIAVNCFGSAVANWSCDPLSEEDFARSLAMLERAIPRMKRLNCTMLRGMSFRARYDLDPFDAEVERQVFRKVSELVRRCADAGIVYAHENCRNYGGQSAEHAFKLLEAVNAPNFKLIFDTGNPVYYRDRGSQGRGRGQSAWDFYKQVRDEVIYVHIKDAIRIESAECREFATLPTLPGDGEGDVLRIVADLFKRGYDGGFSIEPHLNPSFGSEDEKVRAALRIAAYVHYGKSFMRLVERAKAEK